MHIQGTEDFGVDNLCDTSKMISSLPPYNMENQLLPMERRTFCSCWAWTCLVMGINCLIFLLNFLLLVTIFAIILLPAMVVVYFGFQCHSRVLHSHASYCKTTLDDNGSSALIILGFVLMSPLLVIAMAIYCSLVRRLHPILCFQPYAQAAYKGANGWCCEDGRRCRCMKEWNKNVKAWV